MSSPNESKPVSNKSSFSVDTKYPLGADTPPSPDTKGPPTDVAVLSYDAKPLASEVMPFAHIPLPAKTEATDEKPKRPPPPPKPKTPLMVKFRLIFNTYRKLCTLVAILNAIGIFLASIGRWDYAVSHSGAMILGNFVVSVMVRNECFLRSLFIICNLLFAKWSPLWWRLSISSMLQHLGGIHSGCAGAGLAWLIWKVVLLIRDSGWSGPVVCAFGIICCVVVTVTLVGGFPVIRNRAHNVFERFHRYFGWTSLFMTWVFAMLATQFSATTGEWQPSGMAVVQAQEFWMVIFMTTFIVLPWTMTRRVPVEIEIPPTRKVAVVKFKRGMQQGLLGRISHTSTLEYHLFGLISESRYADCHYMVCGVQGDFTKSLVDNPPTHLWTRELKFPHVSNTSKLYHKGIRICTGTGIGSGLSTCMQSPNWFLIWIGSDFERTFGKTIMGLVEKNIPEERRIIWDSKKRGKRPDSVKLIEESYKAFGAEVVFITSNYQGNMEMMEGCKMLGIPCYGTLWDF